MSGETAFWRNKSLQPASHSVKDNTAAYDRLRLRPRVCVNVTKVDASTECFGSKVAFPLGFSPAAMHKLAHKDGECGTSRAAAKFGINMLLSQYATDSIGDVTAMGAGAGNAYGMQVCLTEDPATNTRLIRDAEGERSARPGVGPTDGPLTLYQLLAASLLSSQWTRPLLAAG